MGARKEKKQLKKKKNKKAKKAARRERKKLKKEKKTKKAKQGKKSAVDATCVKKLMELGDYNGRKNRVNFRQASQSKVLTKKLTSKKNKKGDFKGNFDIMLAAAGGDPKKPKCNGEEDKNKTITGSLGTLGACEANVNKECEGALANDVIERMQRCTK